MAETITNVIKVTRLQFEKLIKGETITISGQSIKYNSGAVYLVQEETPTSYEDMNIKTYEEI